MAQIKPQWVEVEDFATMAAKLVEKYPERFGEIDVDQMIAYACVNKDRPEGKARPYEMTGAIAPESFTNSKTYFVKLFQNVWEQTNEDGHHEILLRKKKSNQEIDKVEEYEYAS